MQTIRKSPEWLSQCVMYQLFLRTFTPEGTLAAAAGKLPELAELGIDIVYVCPFFLQDDDPLRDFWSNRQKKFDTPYNPYRIKDYYNIDPEYGNKNDLYEFVKMAHSLGMKVMPDLVFLHCGPTAVFIDEHPNFVKRDADGKIANEQWSFPALNFESFELREYLWENMEYWMREFDVDGYRCDVGDLIPLDFWEEARVRIGRIKSDALLLSEGGRKDDQFAAFDLNYNFTGTFGIHKLFNRHVPVSELRKTFESQAEEYPEGFRFIRYIDNHDIAHDTTYGILRQPYHTDAGWASDVNFHGIHQNGLPADSRLEKSWGHQAVNAALVLCFTMDGVPFLYNGQEVADSAPHNLYMKSPIDWDNALTDDGKERYALCRNLCRLRHSETCLSDGTLKWIDNQAPNSLLSFIRESGDQQVLVLINLSDKQVESSFNLPDTVRKILNSPDAVFAEKTCTLPPFTWFIGRIK